MVVVQDTAREGQGLAYPEGPAALETLDCLGDGDELSQERHVLLAQTSLVGQRNQGVAQNYREAGKT